MWDNQRDVWAGTTFTFTLNAFLNNQELQKISFDFVNQKSYDYDMELIDELSQFPLLHSAPALTIIHLMGQHINWADRFPNTQENKYFTQDSVNRHDDYLTDKKKQYVADYDNATRYNDKVMSRIFELFRDRNAVVIYLSDHGEECFDYRDNQGRNMDQSGSSLHSKYQYSIPFMIWCSDKYINQHKSTITDIRHALYHKFTSDQLCQIMFHLGNINTRYYHPERDVLTTKWKSATRLIYNSHGSLDFDLIQNTATK